MKSTTRPTAGTIRRRDDNRSWNCGTEGETDEEAVLSLRMRLIRNACTVLLCSRGTPMFLAGDEFGNTQYGNNNAYCQDNEISAGLAASGKEPGAV